ncbi:MAG TPA: hypothetical protein VHB21_10775, partial [Minicystis sp.]|nr:hypothetical protein [Minicystis sp.]
MEVIVPLREASPLGGKAGSLARLLAAGLPVPDGVVATDAATEADVRDAAARYAPLAVRSSTSLEDLAGAAGAGVFASRVDVACDCAWEAVRAVRESARAPLADAYAGLHDGAAVRVAVILQRFVRGRRVTVYTRPPGRPEADEVWIQDESAPPRRVPRSDPDAALAIAAERAIGASAGADVELVVGERTWLVQARPIVHPPAARPLAPPPPELFTFSKQLPGALFRWDIGHNPDPLSPAQAALVAAVRPVAPYTMRIVGGYLYTCGGEAAPASSRLDAATLLAQIRGLVSGDADDVAGAIGHYVEAFRLYTRELAPQVVRTSAAANTLLAAARGDLSDAEVLARVGHHAPAWDVAVPTYGERPEL